MQEDMSNLVSVVGTQSQAGGKTRFGLPERTRTERKGKPDLIIDTGRGPNRRFEGRDIPDT